MRHSYFFKSFLLTILLIFSSFMLLGATFLVAISRYTLSDTRLRLERSAGVLVNTISSSPFSGRLSSQLSVILSATAQINDQQFLICDIGGGVLTGYVPGVSLENQTIPVGIVESIVAHGGYFGVDVLSGLITGSHLVVGASVAMTVLVPSAEETVSYIILAIASNDNQRVLLTFFLRFFFWVGSLTLVAAVLMTYWASRRMTRPLVDMASAAKSFERGDFSVRLRDVRRPDELGELTVAFNAMAASLGRAEELRRGFIDNISHELRTPMTTIAGTVDGIIDGTIPPERCEEYLRTVTSEIRRLSRLVARMAELTRLESATSNYKMESFDLCEATSRILLGFEGQINAKELIVEVNYDEPPLWALGDADAITQVVYNLLHNAVKFSDRGSPFLLSIKRGGGRLTFFIENGGPDIPEADLPHVFDRFYKVDRSRSADREGMGLGLYLAKAILRGHQGDIHAVSGGGRTRFTFTLTEASPKSR